MPHVTYSDAAMASMAKLDAALRAASQHANDLRVLGFGVKFGVADSMDGSKSGLWPTWKLTHGQPMFNPDGTARLGHLPGGKD